MRGGNPAPSRPRANGGQSMILSPSSAVPIRLLIALALAAAALLFAAAAAAGV